MALVAVAMAPAIELLAEPKTICGKGLMWHVENQGTTMVYDGKFDMAMFEEVCKMLDNRFEEDVQEAHRQLFLFGKTKTRKV